MGSRWVAQRKVFTTPVRNGADDVSVTNILPSDRSLNKKRGCAAVSIGEKCYRSNRRSWPTDFPIESGPCVKTMLYDRMLGITEQGDQCRVMQTSECMLSRRSVGQHQSSLGIELKAASATEARTQRKCNTTKFVGHRASSRGNRPKGRA